jgi:hypothetical protein
VIFIAVLWPDGTGCLMSREEWALWDWIARPAVLVKFVNVDEVK